MKNRKIQYWSFNNIQWISSKRAMYDHQSKKIDDFQNAQFQNEIFFSIMSIRFHCLFIRCLRFHTLNAIIRRFNISEFFSHGKWSTDEKSDHEKKQIRKLWFMIDHSNARRKRFCWNDERLFCFKIVNFENYLKWNAAKSNRI